MAPQGRYVQIHASPAGPGDGRPTALQVVQDEGLINRLDGKVVLVTGCSSGLGVPTLAAFAAAGATVYGAARSLPKARTALGTLADAPNVHFLQLDLNSLASVRAAAAEFLTHTGGRLNLLVNNAGIMAVPDNTRTEDGFEQQFGVNHLAHFLLFNLVKDALIASSTEAFHSRVVNVSSTGSRLGGINWDNINLEGEYEPYKAYGQSKTANILMAKQIDKLFGAQRLHGLAVHPGVAFTGLQVHQAEAMEQLRQQEEMMRIIKSTEQCASTTLYAALSKDLEGQGPFYLEDCQVKGLAEPNVGWFGEGYAEWAWDGAQAERLWEESLKWVGLGP
ncbi:hypothetical protein ACHAQA_000438 [Verticillium albo-atrum]